MQALSTGRRIEIRGTVQGVGFRPWVYRLAYDVGICGSVKNGSAPQPFPDFTHGRWREARRTL